MAGIGGLTAATHTCRKRCCLLCGCARGGIAAHVPHVRPLASWYRLPAIPCTSSGCAAGRAFAARNSLSVSYQPDHPSSAVKGGMIQSVCIFAGEGLVATLRTRVGDQFSALYRAISQRTILLPAAFVFLWQVRKGGTEHVHHNRSACCAGMRCQAVGIALCRTRPMARRGRCSRAGGCVTCLVIAFNGNRLANDYVDDCAAVVVHWLEDHIIVWVLAHWPASNGCA